MRAALLFCVLSPTEALRVLAPAHTASSLAQDGGRPPRAAIPQRRQVRVPLCVMSAPGLLPLAAACTIPSLLGFYKSEYGVSYAYGSAMLATGAMVLLSSSGAHLLARAHAACIALYGLRLNLFLLFRECTIPRFRAFREKIEARAVERGRCPSVTSF